MVEGIINIYKDTEKIQKEKNDLESFLFSNFLNEFKIINTFKKELYIQFLSSINIFYIKKDVKNLLKNINNTISLYKKIKKIENYISPSLIFYPNFDWNIINKTLIDIFNNHINEKINEKTYNIDIWIININKINYPKNNIFYYKVDWADDLIWAYCIEFIFKNKLCSRVWFFIWNNSIFISCIQNKKIWRLNYELEKHINFLAYLIPLKFLTKIIKKKYIIFPTDEWQVSRIYWDFKENYNELWEKIWLSKIENWLVWKWKFEKLSSYLENINF